MNNTKDAIIVLAGGIEPDGSLPKIPQLRVQEGVRLYRSGVAPRIIMSGKWGFWSEIEYPRTEAQAMKEYAVSLGVPEQDIILEELSKDTVGNAYFTRLNILEPNNWRNIVVVTADYHMPRTQYIFNKILGEGYVIDFHTVDSELPETELKSRVEKEAKALEVLRKAVDSIKDGDVETVGRYVYTKHPGYAEKSEVSKEELRKMLGR